MDKNVVRFMAELLECALLRQSFQVAHIKYQKKLGRLVRMIESTDPEFAKMSRTKKEIVVLDYLKVVTNKKKAVAKERLNGKQL